MRRTAFMMYLHGAAILLATLLFTLAPEMGYSESAEVRVFTSGAPSEVEKNLAAKFFETTGYRISITVGTLAAIREKSAAENPDVVVLPLPAMEVLNKSGTLRPGSQIDLARVGIGVAVREGAPRPDISNVAAIRKMLLDVRSIAYPDPKGGGITGAHIAHVIEQMGIAEAVKPKVSLMYAIAGGVAAVANGDAEVGLFNVSEILPVKGVTLVGPLPAELQSYIVFSGALHVGGASREPAAKFLQSLSDPEARDAWTMGGFEALGRGH